ncbi:MAG: nitronate monooxygenase family protein [Erysipelotrichaceae bacterium]|nr:nitronate monooxygenase family protein [Erysipelotrichaceae bacterium]
MLKPVKLGNRVLEVPIIQGGMGVGVSLDGLAGNVMKQGGLGVISAAHPGYRENDFFVNPLKANIKALHECAKSARAISNGRGLLGVNIMFACNNYDTYVKECVKAGYDAIISGAGMPLSLPEYAGDSDILLAPIVSSGKAANLILRAWDQKYNRTPDFIVIESSLAGGHLGFKLKDLEEGTCQSLDEILSEVLECIKPYADKYQRDIPVFVAGGIYDGRDIAHYINNGASGVQMGTRFIATEECDADIRFKEEIIKADEKDIVLVKSPTGFPGRAVLNDYMKRVKEEGNRKITNCIGCLKPCNPLDTPYCISRALIEAVKGNIQEGLVFTGFNGYRIKELTTVEKLMKELQEEANEVLR